MALAPSIDPPGGASSEGERFGNSGFCSNVMNLFRLAMFGIALEPRQIALVAPGDRVARQKKIHGLPHEAGHGVRAAHAHSRFWRAPGESLLDDSISQRSRPFTP